MTHRRDRVASEAMCMRVSGPMKLRRGGLLFCIAVVCSLLPAPVDSQPSTIAAWKLEQRTRILGDQTVYVCPAGIKAFNRKNGVTIVFSQPFTEVVTFSMKTRKVCRQSFEKSENPYARAVAMFSGVAHGQVPMKRVRDYFKGGLAWTDFRIPDNYKKARVALWQKGELNSHEPASGHMTGFRLPMDKRALDWLARLYCVPASGVIPFEVIFNDVDGEAHSLVKTYSMVSAKMITADFKCPQGLNAVKDPRAVDQDESSPDAFEMMMGPSRK
ncbi:MAG: hypothetical protein IT342_24790 [Candidatus Melainabacteria bacterium]|nr:hypothetical protein [Candidatus Melainabacteria bacterium]